MAFFPASLAAALLLAASFAAEARRAPAPPPADGSFVDNGVTYTPTPWTGVPGWAADDLRPALAAFKASCRRIAADASRFAGRPFGAPKDWAALCGAALTTEPEGARRFFEDGFEALAVRPKGKADPLVTGYYEPELQGDRRWSMLYSAPVYGVPHDLVMVDVAAFESIPDGQRVAGKVVEGKLVPYDSRAEIETAAYGARVPALLFVSSAIDAFFVQIQGSGRVRMADGTWLRIGYAAQNGHPYFPIGRELVARGELKRAEATMIAIRDWLRAHPLDADAVMNLNPSFVFFRASPLEDPAVGPVGGEGVALTPGRSLAVDPAWYPYGLPIFVSATIAAADGAGEERTDRLMIAQDTGGAIRGVIRGDIFFGWGEEAERRASATAGDAAFYAFRPKPPPEPRPSTP